MPKYVRTLYGHAKVRPHLFPVNELGMFSRTGMAFFNQGCFPDAYIFIKTV
jgi:hypothetical protein